MEIQGNEENIDRIILTLERETYVMIEKMDVKVIPLESGERSFRTR